MSKDLHISDLLDFYGLLLTEKQQCFLNLYYNEDLSLSEIAENEGGTRQGVREVIKRAEGELHNMEKNLQLFEKSVTNKQKLDEIRKAVIDGKCDTALQLISKLENLI